MAATAKPARGDRIFKSHFDLPPMYPVAAQRVNRPVNRASFATDCAFIQQIPRNT